VYRNAHAADCADDVVDLIGVDDLSQVVGHLSMGEKPFSLPRAMRFLIWDFWSDLLIYGISRVETTAD